MNYSLLFVVFGACVLVGLILLVTTNAFGKQDYASVGAFMKNKDQDYYGTLKITSDSTTTPVGKVSCTYYETNTLMYSNENYAGVSSTYSQTPFAVLIDDKYSFNVTPSAVLQLFAAPTYEKTVDANSGEFSEVFTRNPNTSRVKYREFCLSKDKTYYVLVQRKEMQYGAPTPDGTRNSKTLIYIKISDKPFTNGKPTVEQTQTMSPIVG